ncbi:SGNH/GDSL hydrolase family protein [Spongiactinospora sp. TRM90649]|uniref:SGNH/GDSL hydrolase family protein n=1 Tax=Spongiactinospora sp. TRM90649 TaxID=3031114 RepID=UPI0023F8EDB7|nr:SGNH/GDSL hydrolase family protein [Spongiactinospora sp. TRM90649]MDF5751488.1 SGNH/GDSL hydrolase family protein [Spongiactinospora sp. TRM90649]
MFVRRVIAVVAAGVTAACLCAPSASATSRESGRNSGDSGRGPWRAAWGAAMQQPNELTPNWAETGFADQSVRQVVRVSGGGKTLRIRLSNLYGKAPVRLAGATVARAGDGAAVLPGTVRPLRFKHPRIPAGGELVSEPAPFPTKALDRLAVTLYFAEPTGPATQHVSAFHTTYRAPGDHRFDTGPGAFTEKTESYYFLTGVEVPGRRGTVVTLGDSITDGAFSSVDAENTYADELAERLRASGRDLTVVNAGIGGNRVLRDSRCFGESAQTRFQRDVLDRPGVRTVIVSEALNDLFDIPGIVFGKDCNRPNPTLTAAQLIEGHRALIRRAHARGIRIIGGTVTPFKGNPYGVFTEQGEQARDGLNRWILTSGEYDGVVDFAGVLADPADPDRLNPIYDGTPALRDAVHPNDAGFRAMAEAVDLTDL